MEISRDLRDLIPLLCDDYGIFAVWGEVFNYKNRIARRIEDYKKNDYRDVILFNLRQE